MAVEAERGCGYRKAGGIYIVGGGPGEPCDRLPIPIDCCPTCNGGMKQHRGFEWLLASYVDAKSRPCQDLEGHCARCPVCNTKALAATSDPGDKFGLMWVGEKFYPTYTDWLDEARKLGISKRIAAVPKGFVPGKTYILVAHPKVIERTLVAIRPSRLQKVWIPGVFHGFRSTRLEVIVTPSMKGEEWVKDLQVKHGATLVEVPENDPDHAPKASRKSARKESMDKVAARAGEAK